MGHAGIALSSHTLISAFREAKVKCKALNFVCNMKVLLDDVLLTAIKATTTAHRVGVYSCTVGLGLLIFSIRCSTVLSISG